MSIGIKIGKLKESENSFSNAGKTVQKKYSKVQKRRVRNREERKEIGQVFMKGARIRRGKTDHRSDRGGSGSDPIIRGRKDEKSREGAGRKKEMGRKRKNLGYKSFDHCGKNT